MEWSDAGIEGCDRFLARVRRLVDRLPSGDRPLEPPAAEMSEAAVALRRKTHDTIRRVTADIDERLHLNTAVAAVMELVNVLQTAVADVPPGTKVPDAGGLAFTVDEAVGTLALLLSPFVPHLASEIWVRSGRQGDAAEQAWPEARTELLAETTATIVVQVNGKLRGRVQVGPSRTLRMVRSLTTRKWIRSAIEPIFRLWTRANSVSCEPLASRPSAVRMSVIMAAACKPAKRV